MLFGNFFFFFCYPACGVTVPCWVFQRLSGIIPNNPYVPALTLLFLPNPLAKESYQNVRRQSAIMLVTLNLFHFSCKSLTILLVCILLLAIPGNKLFALYLRTDHENLKLSSLLISFGKRTQVTVTLRS